MKSCQILIIFLMFLSSSSLAGQSDGKVDRVKFFTNSWAVYGNNDSGLMVFTLKEETNSIASACGSGNPRIAISSSHHLYQSVVSAILAAKASGQIIRINYLDTCSVNSSSWDFGWLEIL